MPLVLDRHYGKKAKIF